MPYNSAAILPTQDVSGTTMLPLARVKKILAVDEDLGPISANASFAITIATEIFIRYFADQAMNVVKSEKKPRKNIQYKDLANAVSRIDNLSFLEDIVPKTTTYREHKIRKARTAQNGTSLPNGQTKLDGTRLMPAQPAESMQVAPDTNQEPDTESMAMDTQTPQQISTLPPAQSTPHMPNGHQLISEPAQDQAGDVEMGQ